MNARGFVRFVEIARLRGGRSWGLVRVLALRRRVTGEYVMGLD